MSNKNIGKFFYITPRQIKYLRKISQFSGNTESALVREALELLFRTPGGKIKED